MARKQAEQPQEGSKSSAFLEQKAMMEREIALAAAGHPRLFYHPGRSCNGAVRGGQFIPFECPEGYMCDVDAWNANGRDGEAPLIRVEVPVFAEDADVEWEAESESNADDAHSDG